MTKGRRRRITAQPTKRDGTPAALDGSLQGTVLSGGVTIAPADGLEGRALDPNSIYVNGTGDLGPFTVEVSADARLGPEQRLIRVQLDGELIDAEAENLGVGVGDEEDIPAAP